MLVPYNASADGLIRFDINKQRADKALIAFAQKANQTIIFSFDLTKKHQANTLKGYHSVNSGLKKLLKGSGLIAVVNNSDQLSIQVDKHDRGITTMKNKTMKAMLVPMILGAASQTALAQEPAKVTEQEVEKISIIGSRVAGRSADDLPVPVDILSAEA
jgi:iron complex outermembrane receptor protein